MEREQCSKHGCASPATFVLKVYTDEGPMGFATCLAHAFDIGRAVDMTLADMAQGDQEVR